MRSCSSCKISFTGDLHTCPLCGQKLVGTATPSLMFTDTHLAPKRKVNQFVGVLSVLVMILTLLGGIYIQQSFWVILAELFALVLNYIFIRNVMLHSPNFLRIIQRYFLLLIAIILLLFMITQQQLLATYVIPLVCIVALITNGVLVIVFRDSFVKGYAKYILYELALGFLPVLLLACNLVTWPCLAITSACVAVLLLILLLILCRKQLALEFRKLFSA